MKHSLPWLASILFASCASSAALSQASSATPSKNEGVSQATKSIQELCLGNNVQYQFKVDGQGTLAFKSLKPNAKANISINAQENHGAASDFDQKLKALIDDKTRDCMKPYIQQIVTTLLSNPETEAYWFKVGMFANWAGYDETGTQGQFPKYANKKTNRLAI